MTYFLQGPLKIPTAKRHAACSTMCYTLNLHAVGGVCSKLYISTFPQFLGLFDWLFIPLFISFQCLCLSLNIWLSIDTWSVLSLVVPSPLDRVLYAAASAYLFSCLEIQTSCYSQNYCLLVLWQRIIPVIGASFPPGGIYFHLRRQWLESHSCWWIIHASDSGST